MLWRGEWKRGGGGGDTSPVVVLCFPPTVKLPSYTAGFNLNYLNCGSAGKWNTGLLTVFLSQLKYEANLITCRESRRFPTRDEVLIVQRPGEID